MKRFQDPWKFLWPSLAAVVLILQAGCAVEYVSPENPYNDIPDRSSEINTERVTRGDVRAALGEPILSSRYWRFDLFRATTEQSNVPIALTPWPIPIARITDKLHRYTLISFDPGGGVTEVSTGLFREAPDWRLGIKHDHPSLFLRSADIMFFVDQLQARNVNLLVAFEGRNKFLRQVQKSKNCTVVIGCGTGGCGDQLSVDGEKQFKLPLRIPIAQRDGYRSWLREAATPITEQRLAWLEALLTLQLTPGERTLNFSARSLKGQHAATFSCHPGELFYLMISVKAKKGSLTDALEEWLITRTETIPEQFTGRPLILMFDGRWYADAEPDSL